MRSATGPTAKTLLTVGGKPILSRLLSALDEVQDVQLKMYVSATDHSVRRLVERHPMTDIEVIPKTPGGYLHDLVSIWQELREPFTIFDCDLVAPRRDLANFLLATPPDSETALVVGACRTRPPEDRTIWLTPNENRTVAQFSRVPSETSERLVGAYAWGTSALECCERLVSTGGRAFLECLQLLLTERLSISAVPFTEAQNVNTPEDLVRARRLAASW